MTKDELLTLRRALHSPLVPSDQKHQAHLALKAYLNQVPDPLTRHALTLYLAHGYTWQRVALEMGWADETSPRKLANEYWENNP